MWPRGRSGRFLAAHYFLAALKGIHEHSGSLTPEDSPQRAPSLFPATRWSVVLEAQGADESMAHRALEELCRIYWYPLYVYARRFGLSAHDAEDQTQAFFARLLERENLNSLTPEKGRMRAYLLAGMKRSLINQRRHHRAEKRGGGRAVFSIDVGDAETRLAEEVANDLSPDQAFDQTWAHALLGVVFDRLKSYYFESGQAEIFRALRQFISWGRGEESYASVAAKLAMNEATVRSAVHRMRARYREFLESEIRETVGSAEDAREELNDLRRILSSA